MELNSALKWLSWARFEDSCSTVSDMIHCSVYTLLLNSNFKINVILSEPVLPLTFQTAGNMISSRMWRSKKPLILRKQARWAELLWKFSPCATPCSKHDEETGAGICGVAYAVFKNLDIFHLNSHVFLRSKYHPQHCYSDTICSPLS